MIAWCARVLRATASAIETFANAMRDAELATRPGPESDDGNVTITGPAAGADIAKPDPEEQAAELCRVMNALVVRRDLHRAFGGTNEPGQA